MQADPQEEAVDEEAEEAARPPTSYELFSWLQATSDEFMSWLPTTSDELASRPRATSDELASATSSAGWWNRGHNGLGGPAGTSGSPLAGSHPSGIRRFEGTPQPSGIRRRPALGEALPACGRHAALCAPSKESTEGTARHHGSEQQRRSISTGLACSVGSSRTGAVRSFKDAASRPACGAR